DATTGRPVEGVRVVVQRSTRRFQSNNRGEYRLERLSTGALRVTAEKEGYVPLAQEAVVKEGEITSLIFRLSPILKEGQNLRVVLTWGDKPKDLDAHLWLPSANKSHIDHFTEHRGSMVNFPFAQLDLDATEGQGPETITVGKLFQGTYMYAVNQWSTDATLGGSGSTVRVYGESGLLHTFTVPEGKGRWWKVFELDGATSSIKGLNQLVERSPEPYPL
ncbi:MAG: Alfa-L-rhamnosidase, partial [Dehalococcoidia bacterium]|nr:Alfa-L-rhamnosidase [Dehalococcoidia bacterium]